MVQWMKANPNANSGNNYRKNNPDAYARYKTTHRLSVYGIDFAEYQRLWEVQGGRCATCGDAHPLHAPNYRDALQVDHDHVTGRIRGLLCRLCNVGLGAVKDRTSVLKAMIEYLEQPPQE